MKDCVSKVMLHRNYKEYLLQALQDSKESLAYLNAALMDEDPRVFLLALEDVREACSGSMRED